MGAQIRSAQVVQTVAGAQLSICCLVARAADQAAGAVVRVVGDIEPHEISVGPHGPLLE